MKEFRYALIRFIRDRERMEPVNAGIILQGDGRIDFKLQPHFARRKDVDTTMWTAWRRFFDHEIHGEAIPLFQPERSSPRFIHYLRELCAENVQISEPLRASTEEGETFESVLESLYDRLAAPPDDEQRATARRPTARFKELAENGQFLRRGMKKSAFVQVNQERLWHAFRQVENGLHIAIDKVEVGLELHLTATEIQTLQLVTEKLPRFLRRPNVRGTKYILIADPLERPFTDQSEEDFIDMQKLLSQYQEKIAAVGGHIARTVEEVSAISTEIEHSLPPLATANGNEV
jgi:hypothetical protein